MDIVGQGFGTGGFDRIDPIRQYRAEDIDHLSIAAGLAFQLAAHTPQCGRQFPRLERRPVAKGAGFAGQNGYVVQRIVDGVVAAEDTGMASDDLTVLPAFQPIGIGSDLNRPAARTGIDRVAVLVEADQAGF